MIVRTLTPKKAFTPIKISITIQSEDELLDLYHRANMAPGAYRDQSTGNLVPFPEEAGIPYSRPLWEILRQLIKAR